MRHKILVPLDGSELAEVGLDWATQLASMYGADLVLLHVCGPDECHCGPKECRIQPMHGRYLQHVAAVAGGRLREADVKDARVDAVTMAGDPAEQILEYASENEVGAIVIATHGRSGIARWALGSVADRVVRHSTVPVRLVRALVPEHVIHDQLPERKILVPLDGSTTAEGVLPHVTEHAAMCDAEVTLLRACEPPIISADYPGDMPLSWEENAERMQAHQKTLCNAYLEGVERRLRDAGVRVKSVTLLGENPAEEVVKYLEANPFNLVAMTTHGRSGLARWWALGSVAGKVLHGTSTPLLLVRIR